MCRCRSRSRTTSPVCPRPGAFPSSRTTWRARTPLRSRRSSGRGPSSWERRTYRSASATFRATTTSTEPRTTRGTLLAFPAGRREARRPRWIGGSIRNPAHFCGVYGHKPTLGVVPLRGHTPPGVPAVPQDPDLAVVGPLARSAEDLALALDIIAGPDVLDVSGWRLELPAPRMDALSELRVALWPDDSAAPVDGEISDRVAAVGERLAMRSSAGSFCQLS